MHGLSVQCLLVLKDFEQMPGNGLAFPIRVRGQVERIGFSHGLGDNVHVLLIFFDDLVAHGEIVLRIDSALLREQIPHVPVGGQNLVLRTQILLDGLRFSR